MIARMLGRWASGLLLLGLLAAPAPADAGRMIIVDFGTGIVYPVADGKVARTPIITNTGRVFKNKYLGTFRISEKAVEKRSNMYNSHARPISAGEPGARMPYWMRLGGTAQGFHYSTLFSAEGSRRRSNGCYRLAKKDAVWLFRWTPISTPVHIVWSVSNSRYASLVGKDPSVTASRGGSHASAAKRSNGRVSRRSPAHVPAKSEATRPVKRSRPA